MQYCVRDDPYVGISDEKGHLVIKNLPVGEHTFIVWQENVGYISKPVKVDGKATTWGRGRMKVTIKPGVNKLGKVELTPESLKLTVVGQQIREVCREMNSRQLEVQS